MNQAKDLRALSSLAQLIRDRDLAALAAATRARQNTIDRLADLEPRPAPDLDPVDEARVLLRHQIWADQRRETLLPVLAFQTRAVDLARQAAGLAVGRSDVLQKLQKTLAHK